MAKLQDDPKVQELLAKAGEKATKEVTKALIGQVKDQVAQAVEAAGGDKATAKTLKAFGKDLVAALKG